MGPLGRLEGAGASVSARALTCWQAGPGVSGRESARAGVHGGERAHAGCAGRWAAVEQARAEHGRARAGAWGQAWEEGKWAVRKRRKVGPVAGLPGPR